MNYVYHLIVITEIYFILALAANIMSGYAGLLSFSQAVFYGVGAYCYSILTTKFSFNFGFTFFLSMCTAAFFCLPIILFAARLRNMFFILTTLAWQIIVFSILYNWTSLTNGAFGIAGITRPVIWGYTISTLPFFAIFAGIICVLILCFVFILNKTPYARFIKAVHDDDIVLMTFGKNPNKFRATAICLSGMISSIAGVLFASYFSYISPASFSLDESILILSIVIIGGLGSIKGSLAGTFLYVLLPELLRSIQIPDSIAPNIRMIIYASILILIIMYRPQGLFGKYRFE